MKRGGWESDLLWGGAVEVDHQTEAERHDQPATPEGGPKSSRTRDNLTADDCEGTGAQRIWDHANTRAESGCSTGLEIQRKIYGRNVSSHLRQELERDIQYVAAKNAKPCMKMEMRMNDVVRVLSSLGGIIGLRVVKNSHVKPIGD